MAGQLPAFPQQFSFTASIPVRITDVNYGNHVGNDAVLSILHEARMQFLAHHGFTELDCGGAGLIMRDVVIEFKKEIHYGQSLMIDVIAIDFTKVSFDIYYRVQTEGSNTPLVIARTGMVCIDYKARKIMAVPDVVKDKLPG